MYDLPPPDPAIEIVVSSRGISKGLAQTDGPQLLVRPELGFGDLTIGGYAKNVTSTTLDGEVGATLGLRKGVAGFDIAASATWKQAIEPAKGSDDESIEFAASVGRKYGALTPKLSVVWSPDDIGSTRHTLFAEAGASYRVARTLSFSAAVGRRERSGGPDYTAYNAGVAWTPAGPLTFDLRYYDTNRGIDEVYESRLVLSARAKF